MNLGELFKIFCEKTEIIFPVLFASLTAIASAYVTFKLNDNGKKRELQFQEKKEAYAGVLAAYTEIVKISRIRRNQDAQDIEEDPYAQSAEDLIKAQSDFAYWKIRCELVGSKEVTCCLLQLSEAEEGSLMRIRALNELTDSMKKDLLIK